MLKQKKTNLYDHWDRSVRSYNFFGDYLWHKYGCRVLKLPINAGFTCPNRDGTIDNKGCIFCAEDGSASPTVSVSEDIRQQMINARNNFKRSDAETKYIAYFQAFTNTYADIHTLERLYSNAIGMPDVIGLMIATRPDCVGDEVLKLISGFRRINFELSLEIGMQTMHDKSLKFLRRGHIHNSSRDAIIRAAMKKIPVCVHIILGIPGETWSDIMQTAEEISSLPISGVKIHHLHVIRGTLLEKYYEQGKIDLMDPERYVSYICDFLERLRPDIIIHRLIGDRSLNSLVAPKWANNKGTVLKAIEDEFIKRCTTQGFLFRGN